MKELIDATLVLQAIDRERIALLKAKKEFPIRRQKAQAERDAVRAALAEREEASKRMAAEADAANLEVKRIDGEVAKQKEKLNIIKNNKEYAIIKESIANAIKQKDEAETMAIQLMEKSEAELKEAPAMREKLNALEAACAEVCAEVDKEEAEVLKVLDGVKAKRKVQEAKIKDIDPAYLINYEKLLRTRDGQAIAAMDGNICTGCHRTQAPNSTNTVLLGLRIVTCQGCGRILYAPQLQEKQG